jgi:hypothetical protein
LEKELGIRQTDWVGKVGYVDLFGNPVTPPLLVRLDRQIDRDRPCCDNIAIIGPGKAQHAAELCCTSCNAHRGWLRREALDFLTDLSQRFGAPAEPIILRDQQIGDHIMADKKFDNSGAFSKMRTRAKTPIATIGAAQQSPASNIGCRVGLKK